MERLEKLINILKLTPHRQPELVKEASHRILARSIRSDPQTNHLLKPLIEILIQYCDNDDSAQRSLFNDYLNSVTLAFQYGNYRLIIQVLLDEIINNGSARTVTAALQRIPYIINNVQPLELGCEPQKLIKALIEVSRRVDDESVLKSLDLALAAIMPYMDYYIRKSKEMQILFNCLTETLLHNLQNESSQTRRLAASSLSTICQNSELQLQNTLAKLNIQLESLSGDTEVIKFVGFCLCVKEIPELGRQQHSTIIKMILKQIDSNLDDSTLITAALETLRDLFKYHVDLNIIKESVKLLEDKFLFSQMDSEKVIKKNTKVILQANALACISSIVKQRPTILDQLEHILLFKNHPETAIRNQIINIIGNYIEASWHFPACVESSIGCDRVRKLWVELRSILYDECVNPDNLKSCVVAIKTCIGTLIESDHCVHIVEYSDIDHLIHLYRKSNVKPFKIEVLNLFASLNYRSLHYLERSHWSKMKIKLSSSFTDSLQDRIVDTIIASVIDEHQKVRASATAALVTIIPNLYVTNQGNGSKSALHKNGDPIVSLAQDLADEHLPVLLQADEHINHFNDSDEPVMSSELHDKLCIWNDHKFLTSSIIQMYDNPYNERFGSPLEEIKSRHRVNISINLMYVISFLKHRIEDSLDKGKTAVSSIVYTLYKLSLTYPINQYPASWDCRPSEYCECFTLLDFLLTYLENLNEPDVIVEDLEAYKNFLALIQQLLYALCHESVLSDYEHQKMKPFHKRQANLQDGYWSELSIKHPGIADLLDIYFTHLTKLLWLISYIVEEKNNPFNIASKQNTFQQQKNQVLEPLMSHNILISNRLLFGRLHRKLESSFRSSKKNLNQRDEKFYQILETCLQSIAELLEFIGMNKSMEQVKEILNYLKITSAFCSVSSLICARQLLKSLFGINILALYQVDPHDWFEEESWQSSPSNLLSKNEDQAASLQGVYHYLVANPYKIFSNYYSMNCSITRKCDKSQAVLNFESRRALKVRRRIEERVKSLFEHNPEQLISPRIRQISELLKNTITEFTPIVTDCMNQFNLKGFCRYQSEILHFMSYLILLRVNYQKLTLAGDLIVSINKLMDQCGEKVFLRREVDIVSFLRNGFTFLTLLSYERGLSKPMFQVATVIQRLDDIRAKLSMTTTTEKDVSTYVVPLLRCLVEDLFIYRTRQFQNFNANVKSEPSGGDSLTNHDKTDQSKKDVFDLLEAERETVAQKLLDIIDNPRVYDLLSILLMESRQNSCEIKFKRLSLQLLPIISTMLSKRTINLADYRSIELTRRIIENISPEVFQPINFIFEIFLEAPKPSSSDDSRSKQEFQRWMSQALISLHILIHQVKEEVFLSRLRDIMSDEEFVEYLLHIAQLCAAEILIYMHMPASTETESTILFLTQQLSCYILYLTHMFQSGLFFLISRCAAEFIRKILPESRAPRDSFKNLCYWAREPENNFSLDACEAMFYYLKLAHPDLTIYWCNIMMLLNNVDCNRDYWRNLLVYECHHCQTYEKMCIRASTPSPVDDDTALESIIDQSIIDGGRFERPHINRPSSLNLSDVSFSDQLRRSFIKRIAAAETRDKALNRNIIETSDEDGKLMEREVSIGNTEQCLSPNIELTRRGTLCLVLDFVTISMNDVEHITWLIIHHINDIIRWSHELPITEFINAVHGNSASSGIFIQAINNGSNNLASISFVTRLLWTLEQVHYTQYGSLVVLLVEKLLSSQELLPYRSLTKKVEEFACSTVQKLLNETNKSLVTTNDEVVNQLTADDLDRIYAMLDVKIYSKLSALLVELRQSAQEQVGTPTIEFRPAEDDSDDESDRDELEILYSKANLVLWLAEQNCAIQVSSLISAVNVIKSHLSNSAVVQRVSKDESLVCFLVLAIYSLALNILPPPTRLVRPKFWLNSDESTNPGSKGDKSGNYFTAPIMNIESKRRVVSPIPERTIVTPKKREEQTEEEAIESVRITCLRGLFLLENIDYLGTTQYEYIEDLIILTARLPMLNSFVLTPPPVWKHNIWPTEFPEDDQYKTQFPMVPHDILSKDLGLLENFCDRLLKLGWINRRQFEEAWMTLLGVLSTSLSQTDEPRDVQSGGQDLDKKTNLLISCKVVATITKLLSLTSRRVMGNPLSPDSSTAQGFDEKVIELTKAIGSNLSSLRKRTKVIFESLELERKPHSSKGIESITSSLSRLSLTGDSQNTNFSNHLKTSAQKLRMNSILNVEVGMQETVIIDSESESRSEEVDVESCIRLLLAAYNQKLKEPNEDLCSPPPFNQTSSQQQQRQKSNLKTKSNQLAPPLATAICQSVLALSDMLSDYEQFDWMFESFVQMFKLAERNEDEIQMQYLILGLCKSAAICCYEVPNELTTLATINHKDVMFEKCRQCIEKCMKSEFGPLKLNALFGIYYMLEDSINIVASGAWELDHFKQLRHSRLTWILKLMPIILDKENSRLLTKRPQIIKLLEILCETVSESESKVIKG